MLFRKAILIIHGFGGGTYDEEYLENRLELIRNFDVFTFTLPGHDGLFKSNMKENEWIKKTDEMIDFLIKNNYKTIYVIGHSMGGVLASRLAKKTPELVKDYKEEFLSRLIKMPPNAIKEFIKTVKNNEYVLKNINIPTLIIQGTSDSLVPLETADYIYNEIPSTNKEVLILDGVNHDIFKSTKKEEVTAEIIKFLTK